MVPLIVLAAGCGSNNNPAPAAGPVYPQSIGICYLNGVQQPSNQACLSGQVGATCYVNGAPTSAASCGGIGVSNGYTVSGNICYQNGVQTGIPVQSCPVGTGTSMQLVGNVCYQNGVATAIPPQSCVTSSTGGYQYIGGICTLNGQQVSQALCGQQTGGLNYQACNGRFYYAPYGPQFGMTFVVCYIGGCQGPGYYTLDYVPTYCM